MKTAVALSLLACVMIAQCERAAIANQPSTTQATTEPATKPTTRSATRPTRSGGRTPEAKAAEDAIRAATVALTKEANEAFRKGNALPRSEPDYFTDKPAHGIDQATLLKALDRSISRDPRVDAYVKLQLLSAVEKFDLEHAKAAIDAYVKAPPLVPLSGMTKSEIQYWDRKAQNAKKEDLPAINEEFRQQRTRTEEANVPIISYRNALKEKIQVDDETKPRLLQARVEELSQRAAAGFDTWKPWQTLSTEIQTWAPLAKKQQITGMIAFLRDYAKRIGPPVYDELTWSTRTKIPKADWKEHKSVLDAKRMDALIEALEREAKNAL